MKKDKLLPNMKILLKTALSFWFFIETENFESVYLNKLPCLKRSAMFLS